MTKVRLHTASVGAALCVVLGLTLNEWVIGFLKGGNLSDFSLCIVRVLNVCLTAIGVLLLVYRYRVESREQIKFILLCMVTVSFPFIALGSVELSLRTWERIYAIRHSTIEDRRSEATIFRLVRENAIYGKNDSPEEISPFRPHRSADYNINRYGLRVKSSEPSILEPATWTIGVLGGSTIWGYNVADSNTIPILLEAQYGHADVRVLNLGISGYGFIEEFKLIRLFAESGLIAPDQLVFYHGGNDFARVYQYAMRGVHEQKILFAAPGLLKELENVLSRFSLFNWAKLATALLVPNDYYAEQKTGASTRVEEEVRVYLALYSDVMRFCREYGMRCDFFLQPLLNNKRKKTLTERITANAHIRRFPGYNEHYEAFVDHIMAAGKANIHDLREALETSELVFSHKDIIHINAKGNAMVAGEIYRRLCASGGVMDNLEATLGDGNL